MMDEYDEYQKIRLAPKARVNPVHRAKIIRVSAIVKWRDVRLDKVIRAFCNEGPRRAADTAHCRGLRCLIATTEPGTGNAFTGCHDSNNVVITCVITESG